MSLYENIWRNEKNRTLLLSGILTVAMIILSLLFASYSEEESPNWLSWLYLNEYKVGLTILQIILLSFMFFFLVIFIATLSEIQASLPSWGSIIFSAIFTFLFTWLVVSIRPAGLAVQETNFSGAMIWTIYGGELFMMILFTLYLYFTETKDKQQ